MERFDDSIENNKQKKWAAIEREIESTVDGLGKHFDEGIKESVIAVKVHGFGTTGSCEGHLDRGLPYPWIDIGSQLAEENSRLDSRYRELWKKYIKAKQAGVEISDEEKHELKGIVDEELEANASAYNDLVELLNEYHELNDSDEYSIELSMMGRNSVRLHPAGVPVGQVKVIKNELAKLSEDEMINNLDEYRREIGKFTKYLKDKFFK